MDNPPVTITCAALVGVDALPIRLEAALHSADGETPRILGRVDAGVREAHVRILTAYRAQRLPIPRGVPTFNFAPASVRKSGSGFDLPMALALAAAGGGFPREHLEGVAAYGEVTLSGCVLPVRGVVAVALAMREAGCDILLCSVEDASAAALVHDLQVFAVADIKQAMGFLCGHVRIEPSQPLGPTAAPAPPDLADIRGHTTPKLALAVAAAGQHNLLFVGPPGSGKSALLRRMSGLLPPPPEAEALEILKIHTAAHCGSTIRLARTLGQRPFRAPHHTSSTAAIIGGGSDPRPGECTMAHGGILFLDEMPEFRRETLEALRQPLEDGEVVVGRASGTVRMPARFQLVAAMNPCPCGYAGHPHRPCVCAPARAMRYRTRLSGPLLDRLDLQVEVPALAPEVLRGPPDPEGSTAFLAEKVAVAMDRQRARRQGPGRRSVANGRLEDAALQRVVSPTGEVLDALDRLIREHRLSGRARVRLLRIARTVADLDDRDDVTKWDVLEAGRLRGWEQTATAP